MVFFNCPILLYKCEVDILGSTAASIMSPILLPQRFFREAESKKATESEKDKER